MTDKILWEYLTDLPEQKAAWCEWRSNLLADWHCFNAFYINYLKISSERVPSLNCPAPCSCGCPRMIAENSPSDVTALCPEGKADPIRLKFKDILVYSLHHEDFHKALCVSLQIKQTSGGRWLEYGNAWHLGDYSGSAVYLTYRTMPSELAETTAALCLLHQEAFVLMIPTKRRMTQKVQQLLDKNSSVLFSMEEKLTLQPDGSFKAVQSISECMTLPDQDCPHAAQNKMLPI